MSKGIAGGVLTACAAKQKGYSCPVSHSCRLLDKPGRVNQETKASEQWPGLSCSRICAQDGAQSEDNRGTASKGRIIHTCMCCKLPQQLGDDDKSVALTDHHGLVLMLPTHVLWNQGPRGPGTTPMGSCWMGFPTRKGQESQTKEPRAENGNT